MALVLHDTFSREKRPFVPQDPDRVTLYVCGPTVYDYAHIGNARPPVVFDVLFRLLERIYGAGHVVYARNITDVDDKINAKAMAEGAPISEITARYEAIYLEDMARLNVALPTLSPHATRSMDAIRAQIATLVENGSAYAADGHVLFDVRSFPDYGKLSGRSLDDMIAGARVEVAPYKRNPHDFVLWKPSKPGEPVWDSPWGPGRPGWHIECSAMIEETLGIPIDIHGGGHDLIFPHHENELAQGRCAHGGSVYARYWVHNGFLTMNSEKMSKSLGNVLKVHDLEKLVPGEVLRWALLSAHYRAPLDWNDALIANARQNLDKFYQALRDAKSHLDKYSPNSTADKFEVDRILELPTGFMDALNMDLNTPKAMREMFAIMNGLRGELLLGANANHQSVADHRGALLAAGELMGVLASDPDAWFEGGADAGERAKIEALVAARLDARAARNWAEADRIRSELAEMGVEVMDGRDGASWRFREEGR